MNWSSKQGILYDFNIKHREFTNINWDFLMGFYHQIDGLGFNQLMCITGWWLGTSILFHSVGNNTPN